MIVYAKNEDCENIIEFKINSIEDIWDIEDELPEYQIVRVWINSEAYIPRLADCSLDNLETFYTLMEDHDIDLILGLWDNLGSSDIDEVNAFFLDFYCGEWDSFEHYAYDLWDQTVYEEIKHSQIGVTYFNHEAFASDLLINDYFVVEVGYKAHVFRNC